MNDFMRTLLLAAFLLAACARSIAGDDERVLFTENFEAKLDSGWSWLREAPGGWKIERNSLLIRTSEGGLWMKDNNNRNILQRPAPVVKEGRLAIEVRVENDPTGPYEHAGLLCYYDDDNYALLCREKVGGKPIIQLVNEIEGKPKVGFAERPWPDGVVWFRMEMSPGKVRGLFRARPEDAWQLLGECDLPAKGEARLSLTTGYAQAKEEHWSRFSNFRIIHVAR